MIEALFLLWAGGAIQTALGYAAARSHKRIGAFGVVFGVAYWPFIAVEHLAQREGGGL